MKAPWAVRYAGWIAFPVLATAGIGVLILGLRAAGIASTYMHVTGVAFVLAAAAAASWLFHGLHNP